MREILCVGQLVCDLIVQNVDYRNLDVDTIRVDSISQKSGGDAMNTAISLSRLGSAVAFCGKVGADSFGDFLMASLKENGVDTSGVKTSGDVSTTIAIALVNKKGDRMFLYSGGASDTLAWQDVDPASICQYRHVHVGGTYCLPLFDGDGARRLFTESRRHGCTTSMDVTWDTSGKWLATIEPCLPYFDLFLPSEEECRCITGLLCETPCSPFWTTA